LAQKGRKQEAFYNALEVKYESLEKKQLFPDWCSYFVHEIKKVPEVQGSDTHGRPCLP
jgi:hypothetical protein